MAHPVASHPTMNRVIFRTGAVSPERLIILQTARFRYPAVFHRDQAVLHHLERDLVLDFFDFKAGCGFVLNDERFN
jgi:hypothetical protein